jgi:site-specific recombinase XerD
MTIHNGRHSFVSHSLHGGRDVAAVRAAVGHGSLSVTSLYAHLVEDNGEIGNLFKFDG